MVARAMNGLPLDQLHAMQYREKRQVLVSRYLRERQALVDPNKKPLVWTEPPEIEFNVFRFRSHDSKNAIVHEVNGILMQCESLIKFMIVRITDCPTTIYEKPQVELKYRGILRPCSRGTLYSIRLLAAEFCCYSGYRFECQGYIEFADFERFVPEHRWAWKDTVDVKWLALGSMPNPGIFMVRGDYYSDFNCRSNVYSRHNESTVNYVAGSHNLLSWFNVDVHHSIVEVFYAIPLPEADDDGLVFLGYKLTFAFDAIRCMVIDNSADAKNNYIFFKLKYPPQIWEALPRTFNRRRMINLKVCRDWVRILGFIPEVGITAGASKTVLAGTTTIGLGLPKKPIQPLGVPSKFFDDPVVKQMDNPTQILFDFVAKIRRHTQCRVMFGKVKQLPPVKRYTPQIPKMDSFRVTYVLEALLGRNFDLMDQLTTYPPRGNTSTVNVFSGEMDVVNVTEITSEIHSAPVFFRRVIKRFAQCSDACESALEALLLAVDECRAISLTKSFDILFRQRMRSTAAIDFDPITYGADFKTLPPNCVFVRKAVVMPTRIIFCAPEAMMTNRVLREFGEEFALRCSFRDDNGQKLLIKNFERGRLVEGSAIHGGIISDMIGTTLLHGIEIAGRTFKFLAWSNSQMRDHGCYLFSEAIKIDPVSKEQIVFTIRDIRRWMGDFSMCKSVPKLMSRMGLCFTQALPTIKLNDNDYDLIHDYVQNGNDFTDELYTFSDGIGMTTPETATTISLALSLSLTPSCFQIRYRGYKGVIAVWPANIMAVKPNVKVVFRESQKKFDDYRSDVVLEVVKYSSPTPTCLNRPLITILDQVSLKQDKRLHEIVSSRIFEYLELEMGKISGMLYSEAEAADNLNQRLNVKMNFHRLSQVGIHLTEEPFFRAMLTSVYRYVVRQQLSRLKINLPHTRARMMYGVVDETGMLSYGQVFIRYSANVKATDSMLETIIHKGKVMVTKNPCHVPGDVRLFEAVDLPALRHLVDVIVFPNNGPRPHPDEMAGSDLDGDEYTVIFDEKLFFDHNEHPMTFPRHKAPDNDCQPETVDMINFFMSYLSQDSIGRLSNAHLNMADQVGLFSDICNKVATKCSIAVDFPKSGIPAPPFAENEVNRFAPDFMQSSFKMAYKSIRLLGYLYRKSKCAEDVLNSLMDSTSHLSGETEYFDSMLCLPDIEVQQPTMFDEAMTIRDEYYAKIQQLIDEYGIVDEASLVAGHSAVIRRISDMEKDDYSFYHSERIVELRYERIYNEFRRRFFEEFGLCSIDSEEVPYPSIFIDAMKLKAKLWYTTAYGKYKDLRFRSFPWIVWDVLAAAKRDQLIADRHFCLLRRHPLALKVGTDLLAYVDGKEASLNRFLSKFASGGIYDLPALTAYINHYGQDVVIILYCVCRAFKKNSVFLKSQITPYHVAILFIQFGLGILQGMSTAEKPSYVDDEDKPLFKSQLSTFEKPSHPKPMKPVDFGNVVMKFVNYLGSFRFARASLIDLTLGGVLNITWPRWALRPQLLAFPYTMGTRRWRAEICYKLKKLKIPMGLNRRKHSFHCSWRIFYTPPQRHLTSADFLPRSQRRQQKSTEASLALFFNRQYWEFLSETAFRLYHYTVLTRAISGFTTDDVPQSKNVSLKAPIVITRNVEVIAQQQSVAWDW